MLKAAYWHPLAERVEAEMVDQPCDDDLECQAVERISVGWLTHGLPVTRPAVLWAMLGRSMLRHDALAGEPA